MQPVFNEKSQAEAQYPHSHEDDSSVESLDKDLATAIVPDHAQEYDHTLERRVLRRIDLYLMPWMFIGYGFVFYDKVC